MEAKLEQSFIRDAQALGFTLEETELRQFDIYLRELAEWNKVMNLTAITDPDEVVKKHFIDSVAAAALYKLPEKAELVDVGCGAGFPGVPIHILRPDLHLTCLDSLNKRLTFLQHLINELALANCVFVHARAEEAGRRKELRARFDAATARAVASLPVLAEYCLPLLKTGGVFLAMKGPDGAQEAEAAAHAVQLLGGEVEAVREYGLPNSDMRRSLIVIRKKRETPAAYPRQSAKIARNPL